MRLIIIIFFCGFGSINYAQTFYDNFDDELLASHWNFPHNTYKPSESDGVLNVEYNRTDASWLWDQFNLEIGLQDFSENPYISFELKSDIDINLVLKPENVSNGSDWIELLIAGNNEWSMYTVEMNNAISEPLKALYIYFDAGSTTEKSGNIAIDNFKIGGDVTFVLDTKLFEKAINDAGLLYDNIREGSSVGENPMGDKDLLLDIRNEYISLLNNLDSTYSQQYVDSLAYSLYDFCITIEQKTHLETEHQAVDDSLVYSAKVLLSNLHKLKGPRFMYGMQDPTGYGATWSGDDERSDVKDVTGSYPAVFNWDANDITRNRSLSRFSRRVQTSHNLGAINSLVWHQYDPEGVSFYASDLINANQIAKSLLPGGTANSDYRKKLDQLSNYCKTLRDNKGKSIPILFRPFHEHNGSWFWWGTGTSEADFIELWRYTVAYLRGEKNIHNFLYVFTPDGSQMNTTTKKYTFRYPGENYVDVHGYDFYFRNSGNEFEQERFMTHLLSAVESADSLGKVAAITEIGNEGLSINGWHMRNLLNPIKNDSLAQRIAYLSVWRNANEEHHYAPYPGHKSVPDFLQFYSDTTTIFLNNIVRGISDSLYEEKLNELSDAAFIYYYEIMNGPGQQVQENDIIFDSPLNFNYTNTTATIGHSMNAGLVSDGEEQISDVTRINLSAPKVYTITSENGEISRDYSVTLTLLSSTSEEASTEEDFFVDVYPIPADDFINIRSSERLESLELYDDRARMIRSLDLNQSKQLRLDNLPSNARYLILYNSQGESITRKLVARR